MNALPLLVSMTPFRRLVICKIVLKELSEMNTFKPQRYVNKAMHKVIVEKQFSPKRKKPAVDKILESNVSCKAESSVKPEATIFNAFAFPITTQL